MPTHISIEVIHSNCRGSVEVGKLTTEGRKGVCKKCGRDIYLPDYLMIE